MAVVKKIFNGPNLKRQSETVMPTLTVALSKSIHIATTNSVKYSRGADSSYEQFYCDIEISLSSLCGLQTSGCY